MAVKAKFVGEAGQFHQGIPARDLSDEDWDALSEDQQAIVEASGLYEVAGARRRRAHQEDEGDEEEEPEEDEEGNEPESEDS